MKKALLVFSLILSGIFTFLWAMVLLGDFYRATHPVKFTPEGFIITSPGKLPLWYHPYYSIEFPRHGHIHLLLASDDRGFVFDVFIAQIPPEKAPGPPGSDAAQRWEKPHAERTAAAYSRHFGFEKGIMSRIGQNYDQLHFYGTDYYVAVPHLLLIIISLLPALWSLARYLQYRNQSMPNSQPNLPSESTPTAP